MTTPASPRIRKAQYINGRTLVFRNACEADAELILSLRTDQRKARHLSVTSPDLDAQYSWLRQYAVSLDQAYFIIQLKEQSIGTVRLYDARDKSFCWGSWIIADDQPAYVAIESALMVYSYALDHLGFSAAHFDVRKANERVWAFHERFGAVRTNSDEDHFFYVIKEQEIRNSMQRYRRFLAGIQINSQVNESTL